MADWTDYQARAFLRRLFDAAVAAADPRTVLARHLPEKPKGRCIVVGAGKASALMAVALEEAWPDVPLTGLVVTRDGYARPTERIEIIEASHPRPDARSEAAARRILDQVSGLGPDDLVIALISGGGSAVMALPAPGLTLADKIAVHDALLKSGATIGEMNLIRGTLSSIKAGRLAAAAAPARVVTLAISDVPGDRPEEIASGPTVGTPASHEAARELIARYNMVLPLAVTEFLAQPTPSIDPIAVDVRMIATPQMALVAAAEAAAGEGVATLLLGDAIEGEAREVATAFAGIARSVRTHGAPVKAPVVLLSGGETTVTIRAGKAGRGGRNTEFLLSLALKLQSEAGIWAMAGDTDGIDGSDDAAGAIITPDTLARGSAFDPRGALEGHDSYSFFGELGDLVITGPTFTNVNDFRAILIV
jgi:hydroxypyruvate reductase